MAVQIRFRHPDGHAVVEERRYGDKPFTIGRSPESTYTFDWAKLSKTALIVEETSGGHAKVTGNQRYGYVRAWRDGVEEAVLGQGAAHVFNPGTYVLLLKVEQQQLRLELEAPDSWRPVELGTRTQGAWELSELLNPIPGDDWRWLAALATIAWRTGASRKAAFSHLKLLGQAWYGGTWRANVSTRLDKVLVNLGYQGSYPDKIAVIADDVLHSRSIAPEDFTAFEKEVKRRAADNLSRADLGLLGWGGLAV